MRKDLNLADSVAGSMAEILEDENFKKIFVKSASTATSDIESSEDTDLTAVSEFEAFERFAKEKDEDEDEDEDEEKEDEEDEEKEDEEDEDEDDEEDKNNAYSLDIFAASKKKDEAKKNGKEKKKEDKSEKKDSSKSKSKEDKKSKKDEKDSKKSKKTDKPVDKKDNKKPAKSDKKKAKASSKCGCSPECECKSGKACGCDTNCVDCQACGDVMRASALKYIFETLTRTSAALDNMGLVKSSMITMAAVEQIIAEATETLEDNDSDKNLALDESDVRGMDLLLGLDDPEALEGFSDEELDDPASSAALEEILTKNPKLLDELAPRLKDQFSQEGDEDLINQLRSRVQNRLEEVLPDEPDSDPTELYHEPTMLSPESLEKIPAPPPLGSYEKLTVPALPKKDEVLNADDSELVQAYNELNDWLKQSDDASFEDEEE